MVMLLLVGMQVALVDSTVVERGATLKRVAQIPAPAGANAECRAKSSS